jgi:penicillin-binding protein 1C
VLDYFLPGVSSTVPCNNYQVISVSADEQQSYCKSCEPASGIRRKGYVLLAPELQAWMRSNNMPVAALPPHNPQCEKIFREGRPRILSPAIGTEYLISRKHPEPLQLRCETGNDVERVYWYINNRFYKSSEKGASQFFVPEEGRVRISCTDDKGRNRDIDITVRYIDL